MEGEAAPLAGRLGLNVRGTPGSAANSIDLVVPGLDPTVGADRIGPAYAAWALTRAIMARRPDIVVNIGTAGGFASQGLGIADLVLARDTMFHDARVALPGFAAIARAHTRLSPSDTELDRLASDLGARVGLASSGSSLDVTTDELAHFARTRTLAKDMELAALAAVCNAERIPLVALKGVTDLVDHHEPAAEAFVRNLKRTCERLAEATVPLLRALRAS
jgi:nucleoside phosphorylase